MLLHVLPRTAQRIFSPVSRAYTQQNVNLSKAELKFQAEENRLSFKSQTGPDFALRCHCDRYAVNQSWLRWDGMKMKSDMGPQQCSGSRRENMNEQNTYFVGNLHARCAETQLSGTQYGEYQ